VPQQGEERFGEGVEYLGEEPGSLREQQAHPPGDGEDPLAIGDLREHVVCEVVRCVEGAAGGAGGADAAPFAREGDEFFIIAITAADPGEAEGEDAAAEIEIQLSLAVAGQAVPCALPQVLEEGLFVLSHCGVEGRALWVARGAVGGDEGGHTLHPSRSVASCGSGEVG
jgi:hypothetical protein